MNLFRQLALVLWTLLVLSMLAGCDDSGTGPGKVHYDRDACEYCRMIISDPRFAAQVRGGPRGRLYRFDDVGDAVLFLNEKKWQDDPKMQIWVADMNSKGKWLEARKAVYVAGQRTPMDFGFGALPAGSAGAVAYDEMVRQVLKRGPTSRCPPSQLQQSE